jgi:hypothetical protein
MMRRYHDPHPASVLARHVLRASGLIARSRLLLDGARGVDCFARRSRCFRIETKSAASRCRRLDPLSARSGTVARRGSSDGPARCRKRVSPGPRRSRLLLAPGGLTASAGAIAGGCLGIPMAVGPPRGPARAAYQKRRRRLLARRGRSALDAEARPPSDWTADRDPDRCAELDRRWFCFHDSGRLPIARAAS